MSSLPARNWTLLTGILAVALLAAPAALAEDVQLTVVKIKASGAPTGAPEIDSALEHLPGIAQICIRFAKCEHDSTQEKKVAWGSTTEFGSKSSRVAVTVDAPAEADGKQSFKLTLVAYKGGKACSKSKSPTSARPIASVSCGAKGGGAEYLHVVMAKAL